MLNIREFAKTAAPRIPLGLIENAANSAARRASPGLLPTDYVIRDWPESFARISDQRRSIP